MGFEYKNEIKKSFSLFPRSCAVEEPRLFGTEQILSSCNLVICSF